MKKLILSLALLGVAGPTAAYADGVAFPGASFVQIAPVTDASNINCANFAKTPDGPWVALNPTPFTLGIVNGIIPPISPIKVGGYIYNNVDLYSQLQLQCAGAVVRARY